MKPTMNDKLMELIGMCKGSVTMWANEHTVNHKTIEQYIEYLRVPNSNGVATGDDITQDMRDKMIETGVIIELQCCPITPLVSYRVVHYDADQAIDEALRVVKARVTMGRKI